MASAPTPALRVLLVEDYPDTVSSFAMLLEMWGHRVLACRGGEEALARAPGFAPQVVFLDIRLGKGPDGWAVAERLRRLEGLAPFVLVGHSGLGSPEDFRRARAAGFDHYLLKPADPLEVEALLGRVAAQADRPLAVP